MYTDSWHVNYGFHLNVRDGIESLVISQHPPLCFLCQGLKWASRLPPSTLIPWLVKLSIGLCLCSYKSLLFTNSILHHVYCVPCFTFFVRRIIIARMHSPSYKSSAKCNRMCAHAQLHIAHRELFQAPTSSGGFPAWALVHPACGGPDRPVRIRIIVYLCVRIRICATIIIQLCVVVTIGFLFIIIKDMIMNINLIIENFDRDSQQHNQQEPL